MAIITPPTTPTTPPSPPPSTPVLADDDTVHVTPDRQFVSSPIGWSSILAATVITLGIWLALHLFGIAVGLTAIDPQDAGSLKGVGIGVGIWSVIAPLIALFIGGLVAGRVAPTINTLNAVIHGAVVWALSLLLTMMLVSMMLGALARGTASAGMAITNTAGAALGMAGGQGGTALEALGIDADDVLAPINRKLEERGMSRVSPENAKLAAQEVVQTAVRKGGIERAEIVDIVARRTALSRADAEQVAVELEGQVQDLAKRGQEAAAAAGETALEAADKTGKVLLAVFGLMALGLAAAVGGSILSVRRERRTHVVLPRATSRS